MKAVLNFERSDEDLEIAGGTPGFVTLLNASYCFTCLIGAGMSVFMAAGAKSI